MGRGCALAAAVGLVLIGGCGLAAHLYDRHWEKKVEAKLAEYRAAGQLVTWAEVLAARQSIPPEENSALILLEAFRQFVPPENPCQSTLLYCSGQGWTGVARQSEEIRKLVGAHLDANRAALATMRKAAVFRQGTYPMRGTGDLEHFYEDNLLGLREAFRLCYMEACHHAEAADAEEAAEALVRGRRTVASIGEGVLIIEVLVRIAGEHIWAAAVQRTLELCEVPADGLQDLRGEIAQEDAEVSLELAFRGARSPELVDLSFVAALEFPWSTREGFLLRLRELIPARRHKDALLCYDVLDRAAEICRLPLRDRCTAAARLEADAQQRIDRSQLVHTYPAVWLPRIARCVEEEVRAHTALRVADAALAVEQWRLAHGRWPDSLGELVPDLLDDVPDDPFCQDKIRYRRTEDGVVVYSVGPDGQDDGGRPHEEPPDDRCDISFRLLDPELRGARTLTFRDEVMDTGLKLQDLEDAGYTKEKLQALGFSEDDIRELGWP